MKKKFCVVLLLIALCVSLASGINTVFAEEPTAAVLTASNEGTRGIYVEVSIRIKGNGDGTITATARNEFTLGPTELYVIVALFSSDEFQMSYEDMDQEAYNFSQDLNIFNEVSATASTGGKSKYWCAVIMYKKDSDDWRIKATNCLHYDANGNQI